jgi:hypothetical protein
VQRLLCAAQKSRTSFHSFRHNFRDELRAARVDHDIAMLLGGWATGSSRTAVSENYGSGYRVEALNEAVRKLNFGNYPHPASDDQAEMAPSMVWKGLLPDRRAVSTVDRIAASASAAHLAR